MHELNAHTPLLSSGTPPPTLRAEIPLVHELKETYKLWHTAYPHVPRVLRYTLAATIDRLLINILQQSLDVGYVKREERITRLASVSAALDHGKFFLTLLWELRGIDNTTYARLAQRLTNVGKMLGGWLRQLKQ